MGCPAVASQFTSVCHRASKEKCTEGQAMMNVCVLCKVDEAHHSPPESDGTPPLPESEGDGYRYITE